MSEAFEKWYETAKLDVRGIHPVSDMEAAYTAGLLRAAEIAESEAKGIEAKLGTEWYLYHVDIATAIRKEAGE
jgi:hypothetical protein